MVLILSVFIVLLIIFLIPKKNDDVSRVYVLPKACETVIQIDQDVKANVRDNVMTGDTQRLLDGTDEWYNAKLKDCLSFSSP